MSRDLLGIHHVTAIAGDPQSREELDQVLPALRLPATGAGKPS